MEFKKVAISKDGIFSILTYKNDNNIEVSKEQATYCVANEYDANGKCILTNIIRFKKNTENKETIHEEHITKNGSEQVINNKKK